MQKPKVYVPRITTAWKYMSQRNVAALSEFSDPLVEGTRVEPYPEGELIERMRGARAILQCNGSGCDEITARVLREVGTVEAIVLAHSAWAGELWKAAEACGIRRVEGSDAIDRAVAEWTVAAAILGRRRLLEAADSLKVDGVWQKNWMHASLLYGSTVGLVGLGRIGRIAARYFTTLGARVIAYDRYCTAERASQVGATLLGLDELLSTADVVSLHLPVTDETRGLLKAREFALIKKDAVFINSARAALYDEGALVRELRTGRFYAYLDVYSKEPLDPNHPLRALSNVFMTSHIAATNDVMYERAGADAVATLRRYFETGVLADARS